MSTESIIIPFDNNSNSRVIYTKYTCTVISLQSPFPAIIKTFKRKTTIQTTHTFTVVIFLGNLPPLYHLHATTADPRHVSMGRCRSHRHVHSRDNPRDVTTLGRQLRDELETHHVRDLEYLCVFPHQQSNRLHEKHIRHSSCKDNHQNSPNP